MRFDFGLAASVPSTTCAIARVRPDYALRVRMAQRAQRRREVVWAVLSAVTLILFWDLSVRLDHDAASQLTERLR